jgi:hypothetical protein
MELHWLKRGAGDRLVVFMLGWAADHRIVEHIAPEGYDILAVYDYGDGLAGAAGLRAAVERYPHRWLFAWSFGVWAAERVFGGARDGAAAGTREAHGTDEAAGWRDIEAVAFDRAVALGGTPFPVHDIYGIEPRRMAVTIRGLRSGGMEAFDRRTYGEHFDRLRGVLSPRPLERNIAELELLARLVEEPYDPAIQWDKAVVGSGDLIFMPENMFRFWGSRAEELPLPHYPFADPGIITREL